MTIPNHHLNEPPDYGVHLHNPSEKNKVCVSELTSSSNVKETQKQVCNSLAALNEQDFNSDEAAMVNLLQKIAVLQMNSDLKDIEIEELKGKLIQAKSNMDQFSYIASHDLKEPLRMVTSYLGLLKSKFGEQLGEKAKTYIGFAIDGGAKLHTMFNSLLDLSQTGRVDEVRKEIDSRALLNDTLINLSKKIKDSKTEIKVITPLPVVYGYEKSLTRLLENLICNAIKFARSDVSPIIEISATEKKTVWEFCIADNGIGIEECYFQQIFAVFSKLHSTTTYAGNGIGLAICKKAVEHHEGSIWVTSTINKGSSFYFTISKS